jgi:hypothetical protein
MGFIRKAASIMMLGGVSSHTRREPPGKAEQARTKAERAWEEAAQAQVPDKAGWAQTPAWACARPEATASASAVWSRSVWSA